MESDNEDDQMRQMMGFAAFGSKPKHKPKRVGATNAAGTSSNLIPLGQRSAQSENPRDTIPIRSTPQLSVEMGSYEQTPGEEQSQWVAARLPNPSPIDEDDTKDEDITVKPHTANLATPPHDPLETETEPLTNQVNASSSLNVQAQPFQPVDLTPTPQPPATINTASQFSSNDVRSDPTYWSSMHDKQSHDTTVAYTSPWTGAEMTKKELREYAVGKQVAQSNGETKLVFFKPSFVEEGIWDRWENIGNGGA